MIRIIYATWGYNGVFEDVANRLRTAISSNSTGDLIIPVDTTDLTDPCEGWIKELNVVYEYEGTKHHILVQEQHPQTKGGRVLSILKGVATTNTKYSGLLEIKGLV